MGLCSGGGAVGLGWSKHDSEGLSELALFLVVVFEKGGNKVINGMALADLSVRFQVFQVLEPPSGGL